MRKLILLPLALLSVAAMAEQPTAKSLVDAAVNKAAKEHKSVLVMFDASW
jgi:hypothetical protein